MTAHTLTTADNLGFSDAATQRTTIGIILLIVVGCAALWRMWWAL